MKYIKCPSIYDGTEKSIFLAGGISDCHDWQKNLVEKIKNENLTVINPRRDNFDTTNPNMTLQQIKWEYNHLNKATAISFWFPKETLCPITLYELGSRSRTQVPIFIGIDPDYKRKIDVEIQTKFIRPEIKIVYDIDSLANQIKKWSKTT